MTRLQALEALIAKVEAGESPTQNEWSEVFPDTPNDDDYPRSMMAVSAAVGWIDAIRALHEKVVTGVAVELVVRPWGQQPATWQATLTTDHTGYGNGAYFIGRSTDPARAWLIALLKALIEKEKDHDWPTDVS